VSALAATPRSGLFAADRTRRQLVQLREPFESSAWEPWTLEGDATPTAIIAVDASEVLVAFVVRTPGWVVTHEELDAHCLDHIARFKRPKEYRFVDELPTSNYGKVLKNELRKLLASAASS
jgi:acyl-CoA synthetase (AMP-forming)/AMP-acid ligase II